MSALAVTPSIQEGLFTVAAAVLVFVACVAATIVALRWVILRRHPEILDAEALPVEVPAEAPTGTGATAGAPPVAP